MSASLRPPSGMIRQLRDSLSLYLSREEKRVLAGILAFVQDHKGAAYLVQELRAPGEDFSDRPVPTAYLSKSPAFPDARRVASIPAHDPVLYSDKKPTDPTKCVQAVYPPGEPGGRQCKHSRGHGPNRNYCERHAPEAEWRYANIIT